ncbi:hypothetical protein HJC23_011494 [Cyclotella cryptica]|uniref:SAP domain-containing protein n=1 Tax=Cyclotella cryptica TaxID=29204 RepID=A0ABD3PTH9_9STRA
MKSFIHNNRFLQTSSRLLRRGLGGISMIFFVIFIAMSSNIMSPKCIAMAANLERRNYGLSITRRSARGLYESGLNLSMHCHERRSTLPNAAFVVLNSALSSGRERRSLMTVQRLKSQPTSNQPSHRSSSSISSFPSIHRRAFSSSSLFAPSSILLHATVPSIEESIDFSHLDNEKGLNDTNQVFDKGIPVLESTEYPVLNDHGSIALNDILYHDGGAQDLSDPIGTLPPDSNIPTGSNGSDDGGINDIEVISPSQIDQMTVPALKALCKKNGLKISGKKADLQKRLRDHLSSNPIATPLEPLEEPNSRSNPALEEPESKVCEPIHSPDSIEIKSPPKPNEKWNPNAPLEWCKTFGMRSASDAARLESLTCLKPGDEGYFDVSEIKPENVTIVRTKEDARIVMEALMKSKVEDPERIHACDTEVMDIDLKEVGPVGNGYVTCLSVYSGEDFDYGLGDGPGTMLWIDNLDDAKGILHEFQAWLEDEKVLKVWHNYGFDRHVLFNERINVLGFGGDTMHMARLSDTSRMKYSLESLTEDLLGQRKVPMKEIFGVPRLRKDGSPGAIIDVPAVEVMQRDPQFRKNWITYSAFDAKSTYNLYANLKASLMKTGWVNNLNMMDYYKMYMRPFGELLTDLERRGMLVAKVYLADVEAQARKDREGHVETFRQWAFKQIGPDGLAMNTASSIQLSTFLFGGSENSKTQEATESVRVFKTPREDIPDDAMEAYRERDARLKEEKANGGSIGVHGPDEFDQMKASDLKVLCKEYGLKVSGKKSELQQRLRGHFQLLNTPNHAFIDDYDSMSLEDLQNACEARSLSSSGKKSALIKELRNDDSMCREIAAQYINNPISDSAIVDREISELLEEAAASGSHNVLKGMLAEIKAKNEEEPKFVDVTITSLGMKPEKFTYGSAYEFFGGGEKGHEACVAFYSLTAIGSIDTMIANFLTSLQTLADDQNRVHCSLNLNTETGRLSSRKPNMQNQPALEKDKYKIRQAFIASPGNRLIVADYGQLELRLLASMTNCKSMIEAFEAGGDFHSRTALGMFKYIQDAVENGDVLLEWDYSKGEPPKPMLKDEFASERRKAKTLNFSIAYGKTAHGLSQDWGVSQDEAQDMLRKWYDSRPEVEKWQLQTKATAKKHGITRTLMGRYRHLPNATKMGDKKLLGHAERASINTPIQGGAADVAMMAMLKINNSELLKNLGWILLMQVHDEVILEGPEVTAEEAFREVVKCMEEPWVFGLEKTKVPLLVDGSYVHNNWYDAK